MANATPSRATRAKAAQPAAAAKRRAPAAKAKETVKAIAAKVPAKAAKPVKKAEQIAVKPETEQKEKPKKAKLVRDSFTMPEAEYAVLGDVKKECLKAGIAVKKSELLRVGVALIRQLDTAKLKAILDSLPALKAGRPKKGK